MRVLMAVALVALAAAAALGQATGAKPFVHPVFSDNMVLQRGITVPVFGYAAPGTRVTVRVAGKSAQAVADQNGRWVARLAPLAAGGPYELTVSGPETVTLRNVLVGDVWVCSGQSNMEMGIKNVNNADQEIADANYPNIRLYSVPKAVEAEPTQNLKASWLVCTPENVSAGGWGGFTAAGYFFGRELYKELNVPIGLIHTSWGGTIAEAWTSEAGLKDFPEFKPAIAAMKEGLRQQAAGQYDFAKNVAAWYAKNDPGSASGLGWADPAAPTAGWQTMQLPAAWENAGLPDFDGVVWFRREFDLPAGAAGRDVTLHLGPIDDRDTTWVNGVRVGAMDEYNLDRVYKVPASALKAGKNIVAVRVLDTGGAGGLNGAADQLYVDVPGGDRIALAGPWSYKVGIAMGKATPVPMKLDNNPNQPTVLFNGMINPLLPYGIKGAIWYQGESNVGRAAQYSRLLPAMIADWRTHWGVGNFPFYIVQLANFMKAPTEPVEDGWAELREAQVIASEVTPNAGIAVTIDIGNADDIHPKDKQDVGKRLALNALAKTYGRNVEYAGPTYKSMKTETNRVRLTFTHVGGGLVAKGGKLEGFAIAGPDHKFVWANADIDGDTIVVSAPEVANPVAVRYAWAANPVCNLYNKAGLPASPFRTDGPDKR